MTKLLPNLPIEDLTKENDYIGIIEKGNLIESFFLANKHEFSRIKFFSIYGDWGSGKSTLMKYLQKNLKGSFNTFFFESWEFESDDNLANSLLELLVKESSSSCENLLDIGSKLLKGFAKAITIKTPVANFNVEKAIDGSNNFSFYELKENFKKEFTAWENKITEGEKDARYNIVFIDDLDRCEPENVLNLLSAIKLFFTFGKKTIFFCGIDRKAVSEAVKTKYGEVVKANEYMEKIFDVSFNMPKDLDIRKLIGHYFKENVIDHERKEHRFQDLIFDFFVQLNFTNPRRIKKVLNKYLLIENLVINNSEGADLPGIKTKKSGTIFETYLTIYLLIMREFYSDIYQSLFNLGAKKVNYKESINHIFEGQSAKNISSVVSQFFDESLEREQFNRFTIAYNNQEYYKKFVAYFSPKKVKRIIGNVLNGKDEFIKGFNVEIKNIEYYFTIFLLDNQHQAEQDFKQVRFSLYEYKKMISNLI